MRIVTKPEFIEAINRLPGAVMVREGRGYAWTLDGQRMAQIAILPTGAKQYRIEDVPFTKRRVRRG